MRDEYRGSDVGDSSPLKGTIAGLVAGLVGTWAMSEFQGMWSEAVEGHEPQSPGGRHDARDWQERHEGVNANELAADAVARATTGRSLTEQELAVAAPLMHYAFGSAVSAAYGALAEHQRWVTAGAGTGFGVAVWAGADETAMPMLGLADPSRYRLRSHVQSFAAHLVFGLTTELVRRTVRAAMR